MVRKPKAQREGGRASIAFEKEGDRLSFSIAPAKGGYAVRARRRTGEDKPKLATEIVANEEVARTRVDELVTRAVNEGWTRKGQPASIDELF